MAYRDTLGVTGDRNYASKLPEKDLLTSKENSLIKGQIVYFTNDDQPYKVMAVSKRYAVCVRKLNKRKDADLLHGRVEMRAYSSFAEAWNHLKNEAVYTICDFVENLRSPNDRVFNSYDYWDEVDCAQTIIDLYDGVIELSKRNRCELNLAIATTNR